MFLEEVCLQSVDILRVCGLHVLPTFALVGFLFVAWFVHSLATIRDGKSTKEAAVSLPVCLILCSIDELAVCL